MKNAKDYIQDNGPGKHTITSLAYWLTPEGLSNPITAAMLRDAIETSPDKEFIEAFDGATKDEARDFLAAYELCAMPYWGVDELAKAIHDADNGRDEKQALRAVTLAQNVKELPNTFTPKQGIEWAMDRGYLFGIHARFAGAAIGTYGHPHNPLSDGPHQAPKAAPVEDASDSLTRDVPATKALPVVLSAWRLIPPPKRMPGYRSQLYQYLQAAHVDAKPCPKAQHVLDAWKVNPPQDMTVIQKKRRDLLEYELEHGRKKTADLKAIQAAIDALIVSE